MPPLTPASRLGVLGLGRRLELGAGAAADGAGALVIGGALLGGHVDVAQDGQRNHVILVGERDAAHAARGAAGEHAHLRHREADALAAVGGEQHVVLLGADGDVDDRLARIELHGDDAGRPHVDEIGELVAPHGAAGGGEHHVELAPGRLVLGQRHDGGDGLARIERQNIDQRLAARLRRRQRQPPDFLLVDLALRGEEQHRRMRIGDEQPRDEILLAHLHAAAAFAAAPLRAIGRERHALDVAEMRDGDDHVLALDQVLVLDLAFLLGDHGAPRRGEFRFQLRQLVLDDGLDARARAQDFQVIGDLGWRACRVRP